MRFWIPLLFLELGTAALAQIISQPAQPKDGPGGAAAPHAVVIKNKYGEGNAEFWLYEPDQPKPKIAPVIVFLHGWGATNPAVYGSWIDHLVKRGNIVIYPRYQADKRTPLNTFTPNALAAIGAALKELQQGSHVRPETDKMAVAGHSVGGLLTANVAALAEENGLPRFSAVMSIEPGRTWNPMPNMNVELADLSKIPAGTLLLAVAGDADTLARDTDAKRVYNESTKVSAADKDYTTLVSDSHGQPPLVAQHGAPTAPDKAYDNGERSTPETPAGGRQAGRGQGGGGGLLRERIRQRMQERMAEGGQGGGGKLGAGAARDGAEGQMMTGMLTNSMDYYGTWKLLDGLCDAAFYGKNREYALGNTKQQRFMGVWSDGTPVKELLVTDKP